MKTNLKLFILGAPLGPAIFAFFYYIPAVTNYTVGKVSMYILLFIPTMITWFTDKLLFWFCSFTDPQACRGLGFDGGPLEWVEWTALFVMLMVYYGLLFIAVAKLIKLIKKNPSSHKATKDK